MKAMRNISLLLNLVLAGCLVVVLTNRRKETAVAIPSAAIPSAQTAAVPAHAILSRNPPKPFQWSQLESTNDYGIFVANLRAIGCPEPTVQDIVRGDADRGFSFERSQLGLDGSGTGKWSRFQEAQTVASLLGEPLPAVETAATPQTAGTRSQPTAATAVAETAAGTQSAAQTTDTSAATQTAQQALHRAALPPPAYPLVFLNEDSGNLGLTDSQKDAVKQLQQQFVNDLGSPNQDPTSSDYLAKWQAAQYNSDMSLLDYVGWQVYSKYQIEAWQNSLTSPGPTAQ